MNPAPNPARLHVDWTIQPAMIFAIVVQLAIGIWWGSGIDRRVAALEAASVITAKIPETIARLDERGVAQSDALARVERKLEKLEGSK